jgi:cytidyltransferase-like protein
MDSSNILSDDDYDVISNPGNVSLDSSICLEEAVSELAASQEAQDRFETVRWNACEIQAYIRKGLGISQPTSLNKRVRVYVDGSFDAFDVGHALQLRQAKLAFPSVYLIIGVFSDDVLHQNNSKTSWPDVERIELVRHCRWVNEVIKDAPWEVTLQFLKERRIDFVAIDEGTTVDPACDKARVKAYDELKKHDKIIKTRRTSGLSQRSRCVVSPSQRATPTLTGPPEAPGFSEHVDMHGTGY